MCKALNRVENVIAVLHHLYIYFTQIQAYAWGGVKGKGGREGVADCIFQGWLR